MNTNMLITIKPTFHLWQNESRMSKVPWNIPPLWFIHRPPVAPAGRAKRRQALRLLCQGAAAALHLRQLFQLHVAEHQALRQLGHLPSDPKVQEFPEKRKRKRTKTPCFNRFHLDHPDTKLYFCSRESIRVAKKTSNLINITSKTTPIT